MRFWVRCDDIIEFEYRDDADEETCERCLNEVITGKCNKSRYAVRNQKNGAEYVYCHDKNTVAKKAKLISKISTEAFQIVTKAARKRSQDLNQIQTIAYHNAKKMNAAIGQKIDKFIPFESYKREDNRIDLIERDIISSPNVVAKEILGVRKTVEQIEAEYILIETIDLSEPLSESELNRYKVHKLVVLCFYFYQEELAEKKIYVNMTETELSIKADYGVAKSAIGQIFGNIVKYCKPNSNVNVNAVEINDYIEIVFSMTSLFFDNDEAKHLVELGTRGKQTEYIQGEGVGLYAVHNYMRIHGGHLKMSSNSSTQYSSEGKTYSENTFTLCFRKY